MSGNWIVDWWKLLTLVTFIAVMAGIATIAKWGIAKWDWWFTIPVLAIVFAIYWLIDRRSKPDSDSE
jgi:hypothetical protein